MYHSFFIYKMSACPAEHCKGGEGWTVEKEGKRDCCVLISWVSARCQLLWGISITTTCREGGGSIVLTCRWGYITVFHLGLPDFAVMLIWGCDCQDNWSCLKLTGGSVLKKKTTTHLPMQETQVRSLGQEDPLGEGNGSPLQYPWLGSPHGQRSLAGYIQFMGSQSWTRLSD